jgi:hypothetical protein
MVDEQATNGGGGGGCWMIFGVGVVVLLVLGVMALGNSAIETATATPDLAQIMASTERERSARITQTGQAQKNAEMQMQISNATATASMASYLRQAQETVQAQQTLAQAEIYRQQTQAANDAATQAARAQETERAWQITQQAMAIEAANATSSAVAQGTALALQAQGTQAAIALSGTATQNVIAAQQRQIDAAAGLAEQALEREQMTNEFRAWWNFLAPVGIGLLVLAGLAGLAWATLRELNRNRDVRRDERGAAPLILIDGEVIDPERSVHPVIKPRQPMATLMDVQKQITENAQKVSAFRALPEKLQQNQAERMAASVGQHSAAPTAQNLQVVNPGQVTAWLKDAQQALYTDVIDGEAVEVKHD